MTTRTPDPVEYLRHIVNVDGKGGLCLYAWHWAGNSWFEVTTNICSMDDFYDEALSERLVRENAMAYRMIKLPLRADMDRFHLTTSDLEVLMFAVLGDDSQILTNRSHVV